MQSFPDPFQHKQEGSHPYGTRVNTGNAYYYQLHAQHPASQSQQFYSQEQSHRQASGGSGSLMFRDGFKQEMYLDEDEYDEHDDHDGPSGLHTPQSYQGGAAGSDSGFYSANQVLAGHDGAPMMGLGINMGSGHVQAQAPHQRYLQAGGNGPFLSPASTAEPYLRERCNSQHSNHSTLSAPPVMQHDMYYPHFVYQQRLQHGGPLEVHSGVPLGYSGVVKLEEAYSVPVSPQAEDEDLPECLSKPFSEAARAEPMVKIESPMAPSRFGSRAVSIASMKNISPASIASAKAEKFVSPASISPTLVSMQSVPTTSGPNGLPPPAVAAALATFNRTASNASMHSIEQASPTPAAHLYTRQAQHAYYTMHHPQQYAHPQQPQQTMYQVHPAYQYQQQIHAHQQASVPQHNPYQFGTHGYQQISHAAPPSAQQGQYTLWPTPPSSTQAQFTSQFGSDGSLTPATATAPRMYVTTSQPAMVHAPYGYESKHVGGVAYASGTQTMAPSHASQMQASPSPPPYDQAPTSAHPNTVQAQVTYLQAPTLSRSYSSPVMPQSAMSMPNTPMIAQTPTFASSATLYTTFDDESAHKSSHFLGVTTGTDLVGEA